MDDAKFRSNEEEEEEEDKERKKGEGMETKERTPVFISSISLHVRAGAEYSALESFGGAPEIGRTRQTRRE